MPPLCLTANPPLPCRDFPPEHLAPLSPGAAAGVAGDQQLNPWQAQHARLVCQVVKEVNELRFVLCPRCGSKGAQGASMIEDA